jgi:DNA-directed RNA polymerase specialized sigma subunit
VSDATALKFILEWILELSEDERKVIYLRIFNYPGKTLKYISNVSWASKQYLSSKFMTATKKIRKYLELNWIIYEDLF